MLAKGVPLTLLWAEIAGKVTGTCKGKGGPMHITHPASGVMVTTGIVGSSMPIANGLALAAQIRGERARRGRLFRRWRHQHRRVPRVAQHGLGVEAAGALRLPEQRYGEHTRYELATSARRFPIAPPAIRCPA